MHRDSRLGNLSQLKDAKHSQNKTPRTRAKHRRQSQEIIHINSCSRYIYPLLNPHPKPNSSPSRPTLTRRRERSIRRLIRNQQAGNTRTGKRAQDTRNQRRQSQPRDIARPPRRDLRQDADLGSQGANVPETAQCVGCDQAGARREGEVGVFGVWALKGRVGYEFILWGLVFVLVLG